MYTYKCHLWWWWWWKEQAKGKGKAKKHNNSNTFTSSYYCLSHFLAFSFSKLNILSSLSSWRRRREGAVHDGKNSIIVVMELACFEINNEHWICIYTKVYIDFVSTKAYAWNSIEKIYLKNSAAHGWKIFVFKEQRQHTQKYISTMSENDFEWQVKTMRYHENLRINDSLYTAKAFTDYKSVYIGGEYVLHVK